MNMHSSTSLPWGMLVSKLFNESSLLRLWAGLTWKQIKFDLCIHRRQCKRKNVLLHSTWIWDHLCNPDYPHLVFSGMFDSLVVNTCKIISLNLSTRRDWRRSPIESTFSSLQGSESLRGCDLELKSKDTDNPWRQGKPGRWHLGLTSKQQDCHVKILSAAVLPQGWGYPRALSPHKALHLGILPSPFLLLCFLNPSPSAFSWGLSGWKRRTKRTECCSSGTPVCTKCTMSTSAKPS